MPDKIHGPNYRWRRGKIDPAYAALYPSREEPSEPPSSDWLLLTGTWNDAGVWDDAGTWND